jgi:Flp pilus assembly protein TadD
MQYASSRGALGNYSHCIFGTRTTLMKCQRWYKEIVYFPAVDWLAVRATSLVRLLLPCACALLAASCLGQSTKYQLGLSAYGRQEYTQAASYFAAAEAEAPEKTDAQLYEAKALSHIAQLAEADELVSNYLLHHPDSFDALETLGRLQQRQDKPAASLATFTRAAKIHTPSSSDLVSAALDYVLLNDYSDAVRWLQMAIQFDPSNGTAWYDLGRCDYTQAHYADAQKAFVKAETLLPDDYHVPENLALTFEAENHDAAVEPEYRKALALAQASGGSDEWPYLDYGTFLITHDRNSEAIAPLQRAVSANKSCAACHEMLGRAFAATGQTAQGVSELEQAVALDPKDAKLHYELGRLYHQAGDDAKAKVQFGFSAKMYSSKESGHAQ